MRLLFITHTFAPDYVGGAEVSLYHTCRALLSQGIACSVLSINRLRPHEDERWTLVDDIPVHRVAFQTHTRRAYTDLFDARVYGAVRRELTMLRPDLVHIHNIGDATLAPFVACRTARRPVVCTLHDLWLLCPNNMRYREDGAFCDPARFPDGCGRCFRQYVHWADVPHRRQWMQRLTANVARFISPSQAVIERHVEAGFERGRFRLIPNAVHVPPPAPPVDPAVRQVCLTAQQRPTLVYAGGGVTVKGADVLLTALPELLAALPDLQVAVAGPSDEGHLQAFARFAPAVQTLGRIPFTEMHALYAAADLALQPSTCHETSSMVAYECFQVGTPVAASAIGGIPELIDEGETGYLFAPGDAAGLVAKVVTHFRRPAWERRRMRQRCIRQARTRQGVERHASALQQLYHELLGG